MTDLTIPHIHTRVTARPPLAGAGNGTLDLPNRKCLTVYACCAAPLVIGACTGLLQVGLIASLTMALLATASAGLRWLLPAFFAFLPFQQSIVPSNLNIACSDVISAAMLLLVLPRVGRMRFGFETIALGMYLIVCAVASARTINEPYTYVSLARMAAATMVPLLAFATLDRKAWTVGCSFAFYVASTTLLSGFVVFEFAAHGIEAAMYSLGLHKNAMGTTFAVAMVIISGGALLAFSKLPRALIVVLLGVNALALVLTLSRSGWIAFACGFACLLILTRRLRIALILSVPAIAVVATIWQFIPEDRREYAADVSTSAATVKTRLHSMSIVMDEFRQSPLLGVGVGLRKFVEPHNMFVLNLGETGIVGTALFWAALGLSFRTLVRRRSAWHGTASAEHSAIRTIGTAIFVATLVHGSFDVYWRRGVSAAGWAAVGMAIVANRRATQDRIPR